MKKYPLRILFILLLCLTISTLTYYPYYKQKRDLSTKREQLAKELGVSLEKYPYLPRDYFSDSLQKGMSIDKIHTIVIGYEKVFHNSRGQEIYYYFSTDDDKANRILIGYDRELKVMKIVQEDENSRTLTTNGWDEGLLIR
jgi:hypothetical protein